ncbi:hypothetical protein P8452_37245 [Trifolium repens]|nr:hypothetical protein P8452_37245 [Trifolium repens]
MEEECERVYNYKGDCSFVKDADDNSRNALCLHFQPNPISQRKSNKKKFAARSSIVVSLSFFSFLLSSALSHPLIAKERFTNPATSTLLDNRTFMLLGF